MMAVEIRDVWLDRATYRPGEQARLGLTLAAPLCGEGATVEVEIRLTWLHTLVAEWRHAVVLTAGADTTISLPLPLPETPFRGYGVTVTATAAGRRHASQADQIVTVQRTTAVDVLEHWAQAPRYGFISDFAPDDAQAEASAATLARYHITIAQFYDWMWRHYTLMPPTEVFTDALGRSVSMRTVRAKVAACRRWGIAALGYAAVYAAEPEYTQAHPEEVVYDAQGKPYSLADLFFIMNLAPQGTWRQRMLATMQEAVRDVPFDGLHLDQYGFPRASAFDVTGQPCDVATDFATFIDDARQAIQQPDRASGVIFNAVENWPIEQVAPTSQDAVYIEVWPPYVQYRDLQMLIDRAQRLAPSKQVILAAYMQPLGDASDAARPKAEAATLLTSAAIWANGGFHLLIGEQDAALHDPYYVTHAVLRPEFAHVMRAYYDFVVRYLNVLCDRRLRRVTRERRAPGDVVLAGWPTSDDATAGTVWTILRTMPDYITISCINLLDATASTWNASKPPARMLSGVHVSLRLQQRVAVQRVLAATPDDGSGLMIELAYDATQSDAGEWVVSFDLPLLHYWTLIVVEVEQFGAAIDKG